MEERLQRYFLGGVGFAVVIVWASLGAEVAALALAACLAGINLHRLARRVRQQRRVDAARARRPRPVAPAPRDQGDDRYQLVPDDPSLVISLSQ